LNDVSVVSETALAAAPPTAVIFTIYHLPFVVVKVVFICDLGNIVVAF
jgi:hypothetical protein